MGSPRPRPRAAAQDDRHARSARRARCVRGSPGLMGSPARLDAALGPWNGVCSRAILRSMYAASSAETVRPAKLRLTPAGLCLSVAVLCVAGALVATGQPIGTRWALLVFGSAFFSLAIETKRTPHRSTTQPPARDQRTPRDPARSQACRPGVDGRADLVARALLGGHASRAATRRTSRFQWTRSS
jgi:hypothetical protein